ncbi:hypothetical protein [Paracoccus rhizosphaerae]|uniref:MYXO-CTERM domain-containing protein n=1 Tax=Paracoccus rhizosphaerae TaxID=1133347 RepID=A0ABV6CH25_9RHOB|nr:hypothetical protein [Paracoccus rhizosphaerae]
MSKDPPPTDRDGARDNPDMLRREIDRGAAADKVDYPDPAAAPLGTDAEASGNPVTPAEAHVAAGDQRRREETAGRETQNVQAPDKGRMVLPIVLMVVVILLGIWALV